MTKVMNNQTISPPMLRALLLKILQKYPALFPKYNFEEELKRFSYCMTNYLSRNTVTCYYTKVSFKSENADFLQFLFFSGSCFYVATLFLCGVILFLSVSFDTYTLRFFLGFVD